MLKMKSYGIILVLAALAAVTSAVRCPGKDWFYRKGSKSCYYIIDRDVSQENGPTATNKNFPGAIEQCRVRGGKLATFENAEELEYIKAKLPKSSYYWVGMTYENGRWQWFDGDTYREYEHIAGLIIPEFPSYTVGDARLKNRLSLYNKYQTNEFNFFMESNTTSNGYICKGDWSGRPWCDVENGWRYHDGRCVRYYPTPSNFDFARLKCGASGGFITSPTTQAEDDLYKSWLRDTMKTTRGWLGIEVQKTAATTVNDIAWFDGTPITATNLSNWIQPDLPKYIASLPNGQRFCGEIETEKGAWISGGYWDYWDMGTYLDDTHDWLLRNSCSEAKPFACEAPIAKCPYGWKDVEGQCYQFNLGEDRLRTWSEARDDCKRQAGDLVVIPNTDVQAYLMDVIYDEMDLFSPVMHHFWIGLKGSDQSFTWVNSTMPLTADEFSSWTGSKLPNTTGESCVYIDGEMLWWLSATGDWNATVCTQKMGYICEANSSANIPPLEDVYPSHTCEAPFEKYHDGCYAQIREKKNRDEAQQHCEGMNATMAYIISFGENLWFQNKAAEDTWLGLRIVGPTADNSKWLYKYSDGTTVGSAAYKKFTDSVQYSQSDTSFNKFCVAIAGANSNFNTSTSSFYTSYPSRGNWYHLPCTEKREFFCMHPGKPIYKPPTDSHFDPLCGAGWFRHEDNCYQIHEDPVSWRLAKQTCQNSHPDSDLLTITSKSEHTFIQNLMINNLTSDDYYDYYDYWFIGSEPTNYWLGLYSEKNNDWHWPARGSTNKWHIPLTLTDWAISEPATNANTINKPRCAFIRTSTWSNPRWYSADCGFTHPFMCKRHMPIAIPPTATPMPTPLPGQIMGCPKGWAPFHGRCTSFQLSSTDWLTARTNCRNQKADLVTVRNQAEFDEMRNFGSNSWIGLNSIVDPSGPRIFSWSNGVPLVFTPWDTESASSNASGSTDVNCGALTQKGFSMYSCSQKKSSVCEMPLRSVAPDGSHDNDQVPGCPKGAFGHRSSCYHFGEMPGSTTREFYNFQEATNFCIEKFAGNLVIVDDDEEQRYLNSHVTRFGAQFWIGLKQHPDNWQAFAKWITGEAVKFTNWGPGQPATIAGEGCVATTGTYDEETLPGDWYVDRCSEKKYALCETKRAITIPTRPMLPTTPRPTGCPSGWITKQTLPSCYKAYVGSKTGPIQGATWSVAESFCSNFNYGHLVSVKTEEEQDFIDYDVQTTWISGAQFWIGLRQYSFIFSEPRWTWSDGTPYLVNNFDASMNHSALESTVCVTLDSMSGRWIPQNCQQAHGWMCEIPKGTYTEGEMVEEFPTASPINTTCGEATEEGEWYYESSTKECLYFSKLANTWEGARQDCHQLDSHLVTIMNKKHHDWIAMKTSQLAGYEKAHYWIGLYQEDYADKEFRWDDGHVSLFRAWEANQPDPRGTERCVAQNTRSGLWRDRSCGEALNYICAKSNRTHSEEPPTPAPDVGNCPPGWVQYRHNCYYFATEAQQNTTWDEAHQLCNGMLLPQSDLASIHDQVENDFILSQMRHRHHIGDFWIGLHELSDVYDYGWSDNSQLRYLNWHPTEPLFYSSKKVCIQYLSHRRGGGRWREAMCDEKKPFICKARKDPAAQPQTPPATKCQPGYVDFDGNCFVVLELDEGKDTWADAQHMCKNYGDKYGDLATISDVYENALVHTLLASHWERGNHGLHAWINMKEHMGHFAWENTCPVVFSNFMDLATTPTTTSCVNLGREGKWRSDDCESLNRTRFAICERRFTPCPAVHQQSEFDYCPVGFSSECTRSCYNIDVSMSHHDGYQRYLNYAEAKEECAKMKGRLASIRTEDDQKCLEKYIESANYGLWIGLREVTNQDGRPVWQWEDSNSEGTGANYLNWGENQPSNNTNAFYPKICGEILPNGTWVASECESWWAKGFICESDKVTRGNSRRTTTLPPGYGVRGQGMTGGQTAGVVIGVLIAVGLIGGIVFIVKTGRTGSVMSSVRSAGSSVKNATASKLGSVGFTKRISQKHGDTQRIAEDPDFNGASYT